MSSSKPCQYLEPLHACDTKHTTIVTKKHRLLFPTRLARLLPIRGLSERENGGGLGRREETKVGFLGSNQKEKKGESKAGHFEEKTEKEKRAEKQKREVIRVKYA